MSKHPEKLSPNRRCRKIAVSFGLALSLAGACPAAAQDVARDYANADTFLRWNAERLVLGDPQSVAWNRTSTLFWYRVRTDRGIEIRWFDATSGRGGSVFDPAELARLLGGEGCKVDPVDLPIGDVRPDAGAGWLFTITAGCGDAGAKSFRYDETAHKLNSVVPSTYRPAAVSPDGKAQVIAANYNLGLRLGDGSVRPLSTSGQPDNYIGSPPDICCRAKLWGRAPDTADILWSPDGARILTYRADTRGVRKSHVLASLEGLSDNYPQPLPGDDVLPTLHPLIIDTTTGRQVAINGVTPVSLWASSEGVLNGRWSADGRHAYILSIARDSRAATLHLVDTADGSSHSIFTRQSSHILSVGGKGGWKVSDDGATLLWAEAPNDATRLARYDLRTGRRIGFVTPDGLEFDHLIDWDEKAGRIFFVAQGAKGLNPYLRQFYSVRADGSDLRRLTPEPLDHDISLSPDGKLFVDIAGAPTVPNRTMLRRIDGSLVATVEQMDARNLFAAGWRAPKEVTVRDASDRFTLHGLLYLPADFDPAKRYPLLDLVYPGPSEGPTRVRRFSLDPSNNPQSFAQLGFVVLALDASGTGGRGRAFQDAWNTDLGNLGLADHVGGIRQLAARYEFIDPDRVGIMGTSAGGDAVARAMFTYPDMFKVGVSIAGSYDYREVLNLWGERWIGPLKRKPDGADNYPPPTWTMANRLKGKLLIAFGGRDDNVNPRIPLAMIDALMAAGKPFETIVVPNQPHWPWETPWFLKQNWDFLLTNLRGATPSEYSLRPPPPDTGDAP